MHRSLPQRIFLFESFEVPIIFQKFIKSDLFNNPLPKKLPFSKITLTLLFCQKQLCTLAVKFQVHLRILLSSFLPVFHSFNYIQPLLLVTLGQNQAECLHVTKYFIIIEQIFFINVTKYFLSCPLGIKNMHINLSFP